VSDFHCVTGWSKLDVRGRASLSTLAALVEPDDARVASSATPTTATTRTCRSPALKDDVLLAHTADGAPLPAAHGGPVRVITPQLYAWKGAKGAPYRAPDLRQKGLLGLRGYSNTAPWRTGNRLKRSPSFLPGLKIKRSHSGSG
jgi:DMSO/TMAO reductase YedYZ molybdopterin-dependent catalytic subunit